MLTGLLRMRLVYGAAAMSAGVFVFSFLQEREEREYEEQEFLEREISSAHFLEAMERTPTLSAPERLEMRKFWRNLRNRQLLDAGAGGGDRDAALDASASDDDQQQKQQQQERATILVGDVLRFAQEYKKVFPDIFPEQQVVAVAELAVEAAESPAAWNGIVESTSTMILSTGKRLNDIAKDTKGEVQMAMHRTVRRTLERALDIVADRLKQALKDPHMPSYLKVTVALTLPHCRCQ
jgi:hypothetical protein